jgi:hypothetical protein
MEPYLGLSRSNNFERVDHEKLDISCLEEWIDSIISNAVKCLFSSSLGSNFSLH